MHKISIANLVLEPATRVLRNKIGKEVVLRPLPYEVFILLLKNNGSSTSRDQLFDTCWEGTIVTDQALTNVISGLRRNLVQLKAEGIEIKTVSKVGYLLSLDGSFVISDIESTAPSIHKEKKNTNSEGEPVYEDEKIEKTIFASYTFRNKWLAKPSLSSVLVALCLLFLIISVHWYEKTSLIPHFLTKSDYQHFEIRNTDFYLLNKTRETTNITWIKSQLESLDLTECNAEIYIRMYDSAYDDGIYSLRGYMIAKNSHRNGNYALSQFSYDDLPMIITEAVQRARLICE